MKIGVLGATGFIGRHLLKLLNDRGYKSVAFTRRPRGVVPGASETRRFRMDAPLVVSDLDAVVNLAGESILGRWTCAKKQSVYASRVATTARLAAAIQNARLSGTGPAVLVNASGTGYYGDTGNESVTEEGSAGSSFLARVCRAWEAEAVVLSSIGLRVVLARIGFVIGRDGGAIPLMRPVFRAALGGRLGSGDQWMSWVHVEDVARIILNAIESPEASGPVNLVSPEPVTNAEFTAAFGSVVSRPAILPVPTFALKILLGEMSELVLTSSRVVSSRLHSYSYSFSTIESALEEACGR